MPGHRYSLHARLFSGPLNAPVRNELQTADGNDRQALEELADELSERGFRVWLYERRPSTPGALGVTGRSESFHVLTEWHPTYSIEDNLNKQTDQ